MLICYPTERRERAQGPYELHVAPPSDVDITAAGPGQNQVGRYDPYEQHDLQEREHLTRQTSERSDEQDGDGERLTATGARHMYERHEATLSTDSADYDLPPGDRSSTESLIKPPRYVESSDGHGHHVAVTVKDFDLERQSMDRTPSPTPEEAEFLAEKAGPDWEKMKDWRFWVSKKMLSACHS